MTNWKNEAGVQQMPRMFRSHVERCLQDIWEQAELATDVDGDWPYRGSTSQCWVSILGEGTATAVRAFAIAAVGLKPTAAVLREINDLNSTVRWVRLYLESGHLVVETQIPWEEVDRPRLNHAAAAVAAVADDVGGMFATVHGGSTVFAAFPDAFADLDELNDGGDGATENGEAA